MTGTDGDSTPTLTFERSLHRTGNSVAVTVPPVVLDHSELSEGDTVELVAEPDTGEIRVQRTDS